MTMRLDALALWLAGLLCLALTVTVSPWVIARVAAGPSSWTAYLDERAFPSPMPKNVRVQAGPGVDVVIFTSARPNLFVETDSWVGEAAFDVELPDGPPPLTVVAECHRIFERPLPRRLCHMAINLQLPRGTHVEAWTSDGGTVRARSPDITITLNGGA